MEIKKITCPGCGATFESNKNISFCSYCGSKLFFDNGNKNINYNYKTEDVAKIKEIEVNRELELNKREEEARNLKKADKTMLLILLVLVIMFIFLGVMAKIESDTNKSEEEKLQGIVNEIYIDIENEDYEKALIKANSLYYTRGGTESQITKKWNSTRDSIIKIIEEKMKE